MFQLAIIGHGRICEFIVKGLQRLGRFMPELIIVTGRSESRNEEMKKYGVLATTDNMVAGQADIVVLAVKPQVMSTVLRELRGTIRPDAVVITVAAGVPTSYVAQMLVHPAVIRAMPNSPASIGAGVTTWTATAEVTDPQRRVAKEIFACLGMEIYMEDDDAIDKSTAVSGSGPAFFFHIIGAFIAAAVRIGLAWDPARKMVLYTALGSIRLLLESDSHPAKLCDEVNSPGGTTGEGLHQLYKGCVWATLLETITASYFKAKELAAKFGSDE